MRWTGNLHVHLAFEILGYLAGAAVYMVRRARRGDRIPDGHRATVLTGAALGATLGARLLSALSYPGDPFANFFTGKTVVGGLLGGLIGVELVKKLAGITRSTGDLFVYPLITAMCIGRIGCFLAGPVDKTAGLPTSLPWGIAIADGVPRHPVALYEIVFLLLLAVAISRIRTGSELREEHPEPAQTPRHSAPITRHFAEGDRFRIFMAGYLTFRFAVDFLKPDPPPIALGLSAIQWACAAGLLYYGLVLSNADRNASLPFLRRRRLDLHDVLSED